VIDYSLALTKSNQSSNNDITDALELTFATDDERFGETVSIELKPGGDDIEVTNENKHEYVEYVNPCRLIQEVR
jgi:E3 ubiquitin-protein ligase NEDD4